MNAAVKDAQSTQEQIEEPRVLIDDQVTIDGLFNQFLALRSRDNAEDAEFDLDTQIFPEGAL